jgi:DNA repair exonuclease SbcCD nuclease subunit
MATTFRFLHAADLHLGSTPGGLPLDDPALARRFAEAPRAAFSRLVDRARDAGVDFAVLAGDIHDGAWRDASVGLFFGREVARLGVPVLALAGNHDAESVVARAALPDPPNLLRFASDRPQTHRLEPLRVALHGQGFAAPAEARNLAAGYPPPLPGWFNLGVLHTALTGREGHAPYAPCTVEDLRARGYDYWALGHVHGHEVVARDPWMVFSGVLQGRDVGEAGAKGAVLVTVEDGRVAAVERLVVDEVRWAQATVDLTGVEDEGTVRLRAEDAMATVMAGAEGRPVALRLRLSGATPLAGRLLARRARLTDELRGIAAAHPDLCLESVRLELSAPPAAAAPADPALDLAALLAEAAADPAFRTFAAEQLAEIERRLGGPLDEGPEPLLAEALARAGDLASGAAGPG